MTRIWGLGRWRDQENAMLKIFKNLANSKPGPMGSMLIACIASLAAAVVVVAVLSKILG